MNGRRGRIAPTEFMVGTSCNRDGSEAIVTLMVPDQRVKLPMLADDAARVGATIVEFAEAVRAEAYMVQYMRSIVGLDDRQMQRLLAAFREFRQQIERTMIASASARKEDNHNG